MKDFFRFRDRVMIASAVVLAVAAAFAAQWGRLDVVYGLALGGAWSIAKLYLRARRLGKVASGKDKGINVRYTLTGNFTLYAATAAVLGVAFAVNGINRWAAVAGLFVANVVMIACEALDRSGLLVQGHSHQGER